MGEGMVSREIRKEGELRGGRGCSGVVKAEGRWGC